VLKKICVLSDSAEIQSFDVMDHLQASAGQPVKDLLARGGGERISLKARRKEIDRWFIEGALEETGGHLTNAAKLLGVSQQCLSSKRRGS
jgi:DNA-binding NtrC family response regulator